MVEKSSPEAARKREITAALAVHLINLDRSSDRLVTFSKMNPHLSRVIRVAAVDGATVDVGRLGATIGPGLFPRYYTRGAIGAAMSHTQMWDLAIEKNHPITVAEDDSIFNFDFERSAARILGALPPDFDFILWGFNWEMFMAFELLPGVSMCLAQFQEDRMRSAIEQFQQAQTALAQPFPLIWSFGITSYTISPKGAREFKSKLLPLQPKVLSFPVGVRAHPNATQFRTVGIDNHMNEIFRQTKSFVCFPPLVVSKNEPGTSTIQDRP
jgi:glycosyl transferase, family 25